MGEDLEEMHMFARVNPVDLNATKDVFISAMRFATSIGGPCPPFGDELRTSAQEQVEYMLGADEGIQLVTTDDVVKSETRIGLCKICSSFERELSSLLLEPNVTHETVEYKVMQSLSDIEWICNVLLKMDLMKDFVLKWADISNSILRIIGDEKLKSVMWGVKVKLIEVTAKVLDAVAYGTVILPAPCRAEFLKSWLPYIRKLKPVLDSMNNKDIEFPYQMDEDLCQNIEGAIVALILALPSNDQADILADWMNTDQLKFPDLSEAFEVWCYRTKSAKRRLMEDSGNATGATTGA